MAKEFIWDEETIAEFGSFIAAKTFYHFDMRHYMREFKEAKEAQYSFEEKHRDKLNKVYEKYGVEKIK